MLSGNVILRDRRRCRRLCFSGLGGNPLERTRGYEAHDQKVLPSEALRILPLISVSICALKRDVEHRTLFRFVMPDASAHGAVADFMDGLRTGFRWFFHDVFIG